MKLLIRFHGNSEVDKQTHQPILNTYGNQQCFKCPCTEEYKGCSYCKVCFYRNTLGVPYTIYVREHGKNNANGMKNMLTQDEVKPFMNGYADSGWITNDEIANSKKKSVRSKLNSFSDKIEAQRNASSEKKAKKNKKSQE